MVATVYPMLDLFWTLVEFALFALWVGLIVFVIGDVLCSADLGGWGRALWTFLVIVLPWIGVVIYLIARGGSMAQRWTDRHHHFESREMYAPPTALSNEPLSHGGSPSPWSM